MIPLSTTKPTKSHLQTNRTDIPQNKISWPWYHQQHNKIYISICFFFVLFCFFLAFSLFDFLCIHLSIPIILFFYFSLSLSLSLSLLSLSLFSLSLWTETIKKICLKIFQPINLIYVFLKKISLKKKCKVTLNMTNRFLRFRSEQLLTSHIKMFPCKWWRHKPISYQKLCNAFSCWYLTAYPTKTIFTNLSMLKRYSLWIPFRLNYLTTSPSSWQTREHRFLESFRISISTVHCTFLLMASSVHTKRMNVNFCWSVNTGNSIIYGPVSLGCRIHRLHLCREVRLLQQMSWIWY